MASFLDTTGDEKGRVDDDLPNEVSMRDVMLAIAELRREVQELRIDLRLKGGGARPTDVLDWLNSRPRPPLSFRRTLETIECGIEDLDLLFSTSFTDAAAEIIRRHVAGQTEPTLRAFIQKDGVLYHDAGRRWKAIDCTEWECAVGVVTGKLAKAFSEWSAEHITDLANSRQQDEWLAKTKKVHGLTAPGLVAIKKRIYNSIKVDARRCD